MVAGGWVVGCWLLGGGCVVAWWLMGWCVWWWWVGEGGVVCLVAGWLVAVLLLGVWFDIGSWLVCGLLVGSWLVFPCFFKETYVGSCSRVSCLCLLVLLLVYVWL